MLEIPSRKILSMTVWQTNCTLRSNSSARKCVRVLQYEHLKGMKMLADKLASIGTAVSKEDQVRSYTPWKTFATVLTVQEARP